MGQRNRKPDNTCPSRVFSHLGGLLALRGVEAKYGDRIKEMETSEYLFEMRRLEREYLETIISDPGSFLDCIVRHCESHKI